MTPKSILYFLLLVLFSVSACQSNQLDESLLIGQWKGAEWTIAGQEKGRDASVVQFDFKADKSYQAKYGSQVESGAYYLMSGKLYTTEEGKAQKNVLLSKLTKDSLVMKMNRVGTLETITLIKE